MSRVPTTTRCCTERPHKILEYSNKTYLRLEFGLQTEKSERQRLLEVQFLKPLKCQGLKLSLSNRMPQKSTNFMF